MSVNLLLSAFDAIDMLVFVLCLTTGFEAMGGNGAWRSGSEETGAVASRYRSTAAEPPPGALAPVAKNSSMAALPTGVTPRRRICAIESCFSYQRQTMSNLLRLWMDVSEDTLVSSRGLRSMPLDMLGLFCIPIEVPDVELRLSLAWDQAEATSLDRSARWWGD